MENTKALQTIFILLVAGMLLAYKSDTTANKPFAQIIEIETNGRLTDFHKVGSNILYIVNDSSIYILDSNYQHLYEAERNLNPVPGRIHIAYQYNHNLFFLLENNTLFIVDSNLHQNRYAEEKLNQVPVDILSRI